MLQDRIVLFQAAGGRFHLLFALLECLFEEMHLLGELVDLLALLLAELLRRAIIRLLLELIVK